MEIKWIKLDASLFDNRKIKELRTLPEGDSLVVIWLQLLCLAGKVNDGGKVYFSEGIPYTEKMLATAFTQQQKTIRKALRQFEMYGMIEFKNKVICITNWEKYQAVEGMDKVRAQARARVQKYRENKKNNDDSICNVTSNVTVTQCNAVDIEEEVDIEEKDTTNVVSKEKNAKRFVKPSVMDIEAYAKERNYIIDAESFFDYYESKGWIVGKAPMKDWKAAIRNWAKNDKNWQKKRKLPDFTDEDLRNDSKDSSITNIRERLFGGSEA